MNMLYLFGVGEKQLFAQGAMASGCITAVKKCWWLKVNTKPVRTSMWDGAKFPHIAHFTYMVDGVEYIGKRWISYADAPLRVGTAVKIYYDAAKPHRYAVKL